MKYVIYTDGGSRGNPGPAAIGVVIQNENGETIKQYGEAIGETTNNDAEYKALISALRKAKALLGKEKIKQLELEVRMDSELAVKQLNHEYKIQDANIQSLFIEVWNLTIDFGSIKFVYVPREQNKEADALVNQALDSQQGNLF